MPQWQEKEKLRLAATAKRRQVESDAIIADLKRQKLDAAVKADLRFKIMCRLHGFVKEEEAGGSS
jgi:hypothetical protein